MRPVAEAIRAAGDTPAPSVVVNVEPTPVHVDVHVPEQPAAVVHMHMPAEPTSTKKIVVERNPAGWIKSATVTEEE